MLFICKENAKTKKIFTWQMSYLIHRTRLAGHSGRGLVTWLGAPGAFGKQAAEFKMQGWSGTPHFADLSSTTGSSGPALFLPGHGGWTPSLQTGAGGRPWWHTRGGILPWQTEVLRHNGMKWVYLQCMGGRIQKMRFSPKFCIVIMLYRQHICRRWEETKKV